MDVQTIQKFKIIHVFGSSYESKTITGCHSISLGSESYANESVYYIFANFFLSLMQKIVKNLCSTFRFRINLGRLSYS
jgi:hypothetical protein